MFETKRLKIQRKTWNISKTFIYLINYNNVYIKQISECDEYVRELVGTTEITSLVGTSPDVIKVDNVCRDANRLVVGGTEARPGEFPHMVALGRRNSEETFTLICGATLISHTWVLSAAHCTYGPKYTLLLFFFHFLNYLRISTGKL